MVLAVFIIAGIVNLIAQNVNYNINATGNPDMDIRVRRDIASEKYTEEIEGEYKKITIPIKKGTNYKMVDMLKRKMHTDNRLKRDTYAYSSPYEKNAIHNETSDTIKPKNKSGSGKIIQNSYELIVASLFGKKKKHNKQNDANIYYNSGYYNDGNGNVVYNQTYYNGYSNSFETTSRYNDLYTTKLPYSGNNNQSYTYNGLNNQNIPYNYQPYNSNRNNNQTYYGGYYNSSLPYYVNNKPQNAYSGNYNMGTPYNGNYNQSTPYYGNYNTFKPNNGKPISPYESNNNPVTLNPYNGNYYPQNSYSNSDTAPQNNANPTPYSGYYNTAQSYNGMPNPVIPYDGKSANNGMTTTTTTTERVVAESCILCSTFSCPANYSWSGFRCVKDYEDY